MKVIDLNIREDGKSLIEDFLSAVNAASIFVTYQDPDKSPPLLNLYNSFEKRLMEIEKEIQDLDWFDSHKDQRSKDIFSYISFKSHRVLNVALLLFNRYTYDVKELDAIFSYISKLYLYLRPQIDKELIAFDIDYLYPNAMDMQEFEEKFKFDFIEALNRSNQLSEDSYREIANFIIMDIQYKKSAYEPEVIKASDLNPLTKEYNYVISFSTQSKNAAQISYFMWVFSSGLGAIEGIKVELLDWGKGSFWFKLKIIIKGWISKKEIISILKRMCLALNDHYINQPIENIEKGKLDRKILEDDFKRRPTKKQSEELNELALEERRLELKSKQLEYNLKEVDLNFKRLELAKETSAMFKDALVRIDSDFTLHIGEVLLCSRENGNLIVGDQIDTLDPDNEL